MGRTKKSQSKHDAKVKKIADKLEKDGYKVQADVKGFPQPPTIKHVRPDVVAKKRKERIIVEVETTESVDSARDKKQQEKFKAAADRSGNTKFVRKVIPK